MISCKLRLSSTFRASALWTNFARCGNPSTDKVEWKAYSADDQNVLVIAGPDDIHIEQGLLADQYKAVLPLLGYYQFMDKFSRLPFGYRRRAPAECLSSVGIKTN